MTTADWHIHNDDALTILRNATSRSVQCCVTSPPYWGLRDYGVDGQLGLEETPEAFVEALVEVFRELRRVLADDGTLWLNLGDSYAGGGRGGGGSFMDQRGAASWKSRSSVNGWRAPPSGLKMKDLVGIPWRVAFALQADGWYLRSDIIWSKSNPMPESVTDRPTKAHEYLFLLSKSERYFYDSAAIREPEVAGAGTRRDRKDHRGKDERGAGCFGRTQTCLRSTPSTGTKNKRTVWTIPTSPSSGEHFATFPEALVEPCILAGSRPGDLVLDPFAGSGTVGVVCRKHGRRFVGIELNRDYARMARGRLGEDLTRDLEGRNDLPLFATEGAR